MGWLWSSSEAKSTSLPPQSTPEAPAASTPTPSKPITRDELAEQELQSFLQEISADTKPSSTKYNRVPKFPPSSTSTTTTQSQPQPQSSADNSNEPLSTSLLPKEMSCRTAFDAAFYCNSFGGRFNDLYRYGTLRSCSDTWNDFWFCMRTRSYSGPEKEAAVKEHYRRKQTEKYSKELGKESSEDVWRSRERKMEWGQAFNVPYEEDTGISDEEWRRKESDWRKESAATSSEGNEGH